VSLVHEMNSITFLYWNAKNVLFHALPDGYQQLSVDQVSIMARKGRRAPYYKVITLHSDGRLMLYTLAELRPLLEGYPKVISEPSGVYISPNYGTISSTNPVSISTARIDVETNSIYLKECFIPCTSRWLS
jgi:hypothetical protein